MPTLLRIVTLLADAFAKEALTALRQAAEDMPQAALTQMNGKQLKKLKKKQQGPVLAAAPAEQTSLSHQKLQAQLAGASEAVPLRLKQEKLAQRQLDADLQDMHGSIQNDPLNHSKAAKKQKKQKQPSVLGDVTQQAASTSDNAATVAHASSGAAGIADGSVQDGTASQKKRRVRFAMKRNLLMQIGGAVPPEEIRTPPGSRPKVRCCCCVTCYMSMCLSAGQVPETLRDVSLLPLAPTLTTMHI